MTTDIDNKPPGLHPAWDAWYERLEGGYVDQATEMIRVYQFKIPDAIGPIRRGPWPNDWWAEFWRMLEREAVLDQRGEFLRRYQERNAPGGYQKSLNEAFAVDHERHDYIMAGQVDLNAYADGGVVDG